MVVLRNHYRSRTIQFGNEILRHIVEAALEP